MSTNVFVLLPEIVLTVTGVLVMLAEPMLAPGKSRKPLGWFAILGTLGSGIAAWMQHHCITMNGGAALTGFAGTVQADNFSIFFHLLIAAVVFVVLLASLDYFEGPVTHAGEYFALVCFGATGMMLMTCSVELLMVFIGLEISSISTYILAGFRKGQASASESALKYFLLGSFATAFFLYGIALAFGATGSTTISALAASLSTSATPMLAYLSVAMVLIGIGFKVSAAPFHVWTPDVYQGAPAPVVALMSTAPKAAAFAVLMRFLFTGAGALRAEWMPILVILAVASMCIGNLGALLQTDVKRLLAYSSIAHAGYTLVAFTGLNGHGTAAVTFYVTAYAAMNVGAFLVLTQLGGYSESARSIEDFTGMAVRRPWMGALLSFFLISLIGIPFTGGFFGKFYAFTAAVGAGYTWLAIVGLANSGIACFYYVRLLVVLYSRPIGASEQYVERSRSTANIPAVLGIVGCALATLMLGVLPGRILSLAQRSSADVLAPVPEASTLPAAQPTTTQP